MTVGPIDTALLPLMRASSGALLPDLAVPAQDLEAFGKAVLDEPWIEPTSTAARRSVGQFEEVGGAAAVDVVDGEEDLFGLPAAGAPIAVGREHVEALLSALALDPFPHVLPRMLLALRSGQPLPTPSLAGSTTTSVLTLPAVRSVTDFSLGVISTPSESIERKSQPAVAADLGRIFAGHVEILPSGGELACPACP